jgi:hypothetical protein
VCFSGISGERAFSHAESCVFWVLPEKRKGGNSEFSATAPSVSGCSILSALWHKALN